MRYKPGMERATRATDEWARERPDLDPLPMAVLGSLAEAAQLVARDHLRPFFAAHGLQLGEFDVLATLRRAGPPHALSPTALFEATMVTSGAMTGRIDRLERAGWVARRPDPGDRRGTLVTLTPEGHDLIDGLMPLHVANKQRVLSGLSRAEQEALLGLLTKLLATLPDAAS